MPDKKHFVYLGCSGFPYGLAEIKKLTLISKSLIIAGNSVIVICENGVHSHAAHSDLQPSGNSEGINYVYTSGNPYRNDSFVKRNLLKIKGRINGIRHIYKLKKRKQLDYAILSTHSFYAVLYYTSLAKLFGFKTILNHVEFYSDAKMKWPQISKWLNDKLYDNYAPKLIDISFPISEFIINHLHKTVPSKKYIKVPILAEFEKYDGAEVLQEPFYFLFSGAAAYYEIVKFIIDSFCLLKSPEVHLYLAIKGNDEDLQKILAYINVCSANDRIKLFSKLTDKQLYDYYQNAKALLIPLRPIIQDEARFPHKIGEYLASGNPVISCNYGEVRHYFNDMETMLIAKAYDPDMFADKMRYVLEFPEEAKKIGEKGKEVALENFNYQTFGTKITDFLHAAS
ncbi:MAG TPA: glycosyltransferase [Hanamia sp.]|nr:glycosyltransferase [Hanamia sp.]